MKNIQTIFKDNLVKYFILIIIIINIFKIWSMNLYPITCDEAYYWLWHKYLSLSFVDHPPVIAYFNKFISLFGENNLFNFRFSAIILSFIVTFYIYKITCLLFNKRTAIIAATISQLVPHYIFIWQTLTMDNLLAVFWVIALYVVVKIYKNHNYKDWYLLGIIFGLGMLTKYTMIFFIPPLFISMLSIKELRKWFFSPHPYCGIIISIFIFSPVILWNIQNNFISLAFHANRLEIQSPINNFIQVILDQLVYFSPILFTIFIINIKKIWKLNRLIFFFSFFVISIFCFFTIFIKVWNHWVVIYQFAAIIAIASLISENNKKTLITITSIFIIDILLASALLISVDSLLPRQNDYKENYLLANKYNKIPKDTKIITPFLGIASQLTFYSNRKTYMAFDYLRLEEKGYGQKQFDLWGIPNVKKGENIIYYGLNDEITFQKLQQHFTKVEKRIDLDIQLMESYLDKLVPYYCYDFSGKVQL